MRWKKEKKKLKGLNDGIRKFTETNSAVFLPIDF